MDAIVTTAMDTSPSLPSNLPSAFAPIVRSPIVAVPHVDQSSHLLRDNPPGFPNSVERPSVLANSMHVSMPDLAAPVKMNAMPSPPSHSNFPSQCEPFGMAPHLESKLELESSCNILPSVDAPVPASSIHVAPPAYSVRTSSLAAALNSPSVPVGCMRAGSTASPGSHLAAISAIGYPSMNGGIAPVDSTGLQFLSMFPDRNGTLENPPEISSGQPLQELGDILGTIAKTAQTAQTACTLGQSDEATDKIAELQRAISWVSSAIAHISVSKSASSRDVPAASSVGHSPPMTQGVLIGNPSPLPIESHPMNLQVSPEGSDMSRKRCASSMAGEAGDRVIKAPKMEPQDEILLPIANSAPQLLPVTHLFSAPTAALPPAAAVNHSLPPSAPSSRPPSPGMLSMGLHQQQPPARLNFSHMIPSKAPPIDFSLNPSFPPQSTAPFPVVTRNRSSWSEAAGAIPHRHHQHSLSGTSVGSPANMQGIPVSQPTSAPPFTAPGTFGPPTSHSPPKQRPVMIGAINPPAGRMTRSGSMTSLNLPFGYGEVPTLDSFDFTRQSTSLAVSQPQLQPQPQPQPQAMSNDSDDGDESDDDNDSQWKSGTHGSSPEAGPSGIHGNEVPQEYRAEVDRVFFEFLNKICSDLDAADSKGEPIHQTLMAKKMQRLDESPDFRPFKFRIAAFTNAFLEELARQGYPEEKIPMKKIRNYLWKQVYIQRFNEDGKKAKSKGNHIWNIDAKKGRDGTWVFRPFHRKLAGSPPGIAYVGLRWQWTQRIWDPQASSTHIPVTYSSPYLPSWLSWKEDVLSGTPPTDAENCDIIAEATFMRDGQEERLSLEFHIVIAPISAVDSTFPSSRRSSIAGQTTPRRVQSDPTIQQVASRSTSRSQNPGAQPATSQGAQVMQVLTSAAQRVAQEAQSQVISPTFDAERELQALAKQQHVLTRTAEAYDKESRQEGMLQSSNSVLAAHAQQVVLQAARTVRADRSAAANVAGALPSQAAPTPQVTVNEVSVATQSAVAQAVEITGPHSSEVDVLRAATSLLQQHARI